MSISKITEQTMVDFLTISNKSFDLIKFKLEKIIFDREIIDDFSINKYLQEEIKLKANYDNRFRISAGVTGMAIIEYVVQKNYPYSYITQLTNFKRRIYPNILKVREKVLDEEPASEFEDSYEYPELKIFSTEDFIYFVTEKSKEIQNLVNKILEYKNLYFHFYSGLGQIVLGEIIANRNTAFENLELRKLIDEKIYEVIMLSEYFFDNT